MQVDGTEEEGLLNAKGVTGYPTLKLYRKGELVPYTGGRMAPEIVAWLDKKIGPPALPLADLKEVEDFTRKHEVAVVGFFAPESKELASYNLACKDYDDYGVHYPVAVTTDPAAAKHYDAEGKVVLFKKFDEKKVIYEGELGVQQVRDSITENSIMRALTKATEGRTSIIIAHRLSTVVNCDIIMVLDKGQIVETGSHHELLADPNSMYSKLWQSQNKTK